MYYYAILSMNEISNNRKFHFTFRKRYTINKTKYINSKDRKPVYKCDKNDIGESIILLENELDELFTNNLKDLDDFNIIGDQM